MRIHIGEKIKARAKELRIGPTELGKKINTSKQNVYGIYKRESIDTYLLMKLSKALDYNFFHHFLDPKLSITNEELPEYLIGKDAALLQQELDAARKELAELKEKYDILKKLYELTEYNARKNQDGRKKGRH